MLQEADDILLSEIKKAGLYRQIWQSFGVLLPVKSVGVMGDIRTYEHTLAIRAVHSTEDRKSTRLTSHSQISYAVFCLKKKKKNNHAPHGIRRKRSPAQLTYAAIDSQNDSYANGFRHDEPCHMTGVLSDDYSNDHIHLQD